VPAELAKVTVFPFTTGFGVAVVDSDVQAAVAVNSNGRP